MSEFNPYSPISLPDNPPINKTSIRALLLPPAIGIILLSTIQILAAIAGYSLLFRGFVSITSISPQSSMNFVYPNYVLTWISVIFSFALIVGSVGIIWRGSYAWVLTTCVLALIPFIGPCYCLSIPFGIWGLIVLARPGAREALNIKRSR